jgi:hypothetical protein
MVETCSMWSPPSYYSPVYAFVFLEVAFLHVSTQKPRRYFSPSLIRSTCPATLHRNINRVRGARPSAAPWRGLRPIRHIGAHRSLVACDVTGGLFLAQRSPDSRPGQLIAAVVLLRRSGSPVGKVVGLPTRLQFWLARELCFAMKSPRLRPLVLLLTVVLRWRVWSIRRMALAGQKESLCLCHVSCCLDQWDVSVPYCVGPNRNASCFLYPVSYCTLSTEHMKICRNQFRTLTNMHGSHSLKAMITCCGTVSNPLYQSLPQLFYCTGLSVSPSM